MEDNGYFIKSLFMKLAVPSVVALLGFISCSMISGVIAGNFFGSDGLAVLSLCSPVPSLFLALGALVGGGASVCANKYVARDDFASVNNLYSISIIVTVLLALLIIIVGLPFSSSVARMLSSNEALLPEIQAYNFYTVIFGLFIMLTFILANFARLDGKPYAVMYIYVSMPPANGLFSYIFINRLGMGIEALALGFSLSAVVACATGFLLLTIKRGNLHWVMPSDFISNTKQILIDGSPVAIGNFCLPLRMFAINTMLMKLGGESTVAVFSVASTVNNAAVALQTGIGQVIVPLVGVFKEEHDYASIRQTVTHALKIGGVCTLVLSMLFILFNGQIGLIFGITGGQEQTMLNTALSFLSVSLIFALFNVIFIFYYNAVSKIISANIITTCRSLLYSVFFAAALSGIWGAFGIWMSVLCTEIAVSLTVVIISKYHRVKNNRLSPLLLIDNILEKNKKYIAFSVENKNDSISEASEKTMAFCEENNMPAKHSMLIGLSIEEMVMLIARHSLPRETHSAVSVRLFLTESATILRMRYTGKKFNPLVYYEKNISGDIEASLEVLGIKYILGISDVVYYQETLGVNNLVILI